MDDFIMKITQDMVTVFNQKLKEMECSFKIQLDKAGVGICNNPSCEIVPANSKFIETSIINVTDEFYKFLEDFFKERGIELTYNNTGSIFWSKNGWGNVVKEMTEKAMENLEKK